MIKKYLHWKRQQRTFIQWLIAFLENILFWGILYWALSFIDFGIENEKESLGFRLYQAVFMGLFWTIVLEWKLTKQVFKKQLQ